VVSDDTTIALLDAISNRIERLVSKYRQHLPLPCNDEVRAKLLENCVEEAGPLSEPCLVWTGYRAIDGYGRYQGRYLAHRLSYRNFVGPFDEDLQINHHCDNPACIEPAHLYAGTAQDNVDDMFARGRAKIVDLKRGRYRGIYLQRDTYWVARISVNKRRLYLGTFPNETDAAICWNYHAAYLGHAAELNEIRADQYIHD
jgi:hypothetical protein